MDQLPQEIINNVLIYVDQNSKLRLRQTCTTLFNIIDHRNFVVYFARSKQISKIVKVLSRYQYPISLTFTKSKQFKPKAINTLSKLTNLANLSIDTNEQTEIKEILGLSCLTNLESFILNGSRTVLDSFRNLTHLDAFNIRPALFDARTNLVSLKVNAHLSFIPEIPMLSKITTLTIETTNKWDTKTINALDTATSLKELDLIFKGGVQFSMGPPVPLSLSALTNLEYLRTLQFEVTDVERCTNITSLHYWGLNLPQSTTNSWTLLPSLKKLKMITTYTNDGNQPEDHAFDFFSSLTSLNDLWIETLDQPMPNNTLQVLPSTLTALEIEPSNNIDVSDLKSLINLRWLKLGAKYMETLDYNFLCHLVHLTHLDVVSSSVSNYDTLTCVSSLTKLKLLHIDLIRDRDINNFDLSQLPYLESLRLPSLNEEILSSLSQATRLTHLQIVAIKELRSYDKFATLPLRSIMFNTADVPSKLWQLALLHLTALESLTCDISVPELIPTLTTMQHLTKLHILSCYNFDLKYLVCLTTLQHLTVPGKRRNRPSAPKTWSEQCCKLTKIMPYLIKVQQTMTYS